MDLPHVLLLVSVALSGAALLGLLARRIRFPVTVVLAMAGALLGSFTNLPLETLMRSEMFEHVLVFVFLPVLVFSEAIGLSTRAFFRNLLPILVLAVPAVLVSTALIGATLSFGLGLPLLVALLFGALISATDPVAVVAIFRQLGVPERLLMLVEGESLLNDGVAIVLYQILLLAALGAPLSISDGIIDFLRVFAGGVTIGALLGLLVALALPWLSGAWAVTTSVALAYGSYVLADEVLGFSGVLATVTAGLVISGFAPSRASRETRVAWREVWEALAFIANALLFLLVGLAIDLNIIREHPGAISLAIAAVLASRALTVVPLVSALERLAHIPRVGWRNVAVLTWGGLRGGVAIALALALPDEFVYRDVIVAMTGAVVLTTLLVNASTVGWLVRRLGLDQPTRVDRFLQLAARLDGARAARTRLKELGVHSTVIQSALERTEREAQTQLQQLHLTDDEQADVVIRRGLVVERETYQRLRDAGLLPPSAALTLLSKVNDQIEDVMTGTATEEREVRQERRPGWRVLERLVASLPQPLTTDAREVAYAEANARRLASHRTNVALQFFDDLPNVSDRAVEQARATFDRWERAALDSLENLDRTVGDARETIHRQQGEVVSRMAAREELENLANVGVLPRSAVEKATEDLPGHE